jgi:hypothetical protein
MQLKYVLEDSPKAGLSERGFWLSESTGQTRYY